MSTKKRSSRKHDRCSICGRRAEKAPPAMTFDTEGSALVTAMRKGDNAVLEQSVRYHNILHHHLWRGRYDSMQAAMQGELGQRGLPVPKPITMRHAYLVTQQFGTNALLGWALLYDAMLYWAATGKTDYNRDNPGGEIIRVPWAGAFQEKPLRECSEEEVKEATRAAKPPLPKSSDLSTQEAALQKVLQIGLSKLVGDEGRGSLQLKKPKGKLFLKVSLYMAVDRAGGLAALFKRLT